MRGRRSIGIDPYSLKGRLIRWVWRILFREEWSMTVRLVEGMNQAIAEAWGEDA